MSIAIYTRVASFHAHDHEVKHFQQEDACRAFAEARNWPVFEVYSDNGVSRGERDRMLQDGMAGRFDTVLAWDVTRLARRPADLTPYVDSGLRLVTANGQLDTHRAADSWLLRLQISYEALEPERVFRDDNLATLF